MALDAAERQRRIVRERDRAIVWGDARIGALTGEITRLRRVQSAARSERMTAEQRASNLCKKMLSSFEAPALDPAVDDALLDFIKRKKESMPDAFT